MENFQQYDQNQSLDPICTCCKAELLLDGLVHLKITPLVYFYLILEIRLTLFLTSLANLKSRIWQRSSFLACCVLLSVSRHPPFPAEKARWWGFARGWYWQQTKALYSQLSHLRSGQVIQSKVPFPLPAPDFEVLLLCRHLVNSKWTLLLIILIWLFHTLLGSLKETSRIHPLLNPWLKLLQSRLLPALAQQLLQEVQMAFLCSW